jgi:hypothetical protein
MRQDQICLCVEVMFKAFETYIYNADRSAIDASRGRMRASSSYLVMARGLRFSAVGHGPSKSMISA